MAKTLSAFPDEDESQKRGRYPWDKWLDGQVWELKKGSRTEVESGEADYAVTTKSFRSAVMQATVTRKGDVRTAVLEEGNKLVVQFVPGQELTETDDPATGE